MICQWVMPKGTDGQWLGPKKWDLRVKKEFLSHVLFSEHARILPYELHDAIINILCRCMQKPLTANNWMGEIDKAVKEKMLAINAGDDDKSEIDLSNGLLLRASLQYVTTLIEEPAKKIKLVKRRRSLVGAHSRVIGRAEGGPAGGAGGSAKTPMTTGQKARAAARAVMRVVPVPPRSSTRRSASTLSPLSDGARPNSASSVSAVIGDPEEMHAGGSGCVLPKLS